MNTGLHVGGRRMKWFKRLIETFASPDRLEGGTDLSRRVMRLANQEAKRFNHEYIGTEHVLLGLIEAGGRAAEVLEKFHADPQAIRKEVEKIVESGPDMVTMGRLPFTPRTKKVIEYANQEADLSGNAVDTEHILLGLLRAQEGVAAQVLIHLGLTLEKVREELGIKAED